MFNNNFPNFKVNSLKITKGTVNKSTSTAIKEETRIKNNESTPDQKMDNTEVFIGRCCIGELCKFESQVIMPDQSCTKCDGRIHYNCAILNGSDYICKKCYFISMPEGSRDKNTCSVPKLSEAIRRGPIIQEALNALKRTEISENIHKACVCVICDSFIIGIEKIHWLSELALKRKEAYLSVAYVERTSGKKIPHDLRIQYQLENNTNLSDLLLSPRCHIKDGFYSSCFTCFNNIRKKNVEKPPRFGITNGWLIGEIPKSVVDFEIEDMLTASVA